MQNILQHHYLNLLIFELKKLVCCQMTCKCKPLQEYNMKSITFLGLKLASLICLIFFINLLVFQVENRSLPPLLLNPREAPG